MNRSQRCGQCRGCTAKPCGRCIYCQDSPQFGGPGVKKQSCIERRCLKVLENRLQRDGPTVKAKAGCANCDECMTPDCQACLVCLDRKFFDNRYLTGAMCVKKRCNQSRSLEHSFNPPPPIPHSPVQQNGTGQGPAHVQQQQPDPYNPSTPRRVVEGVYSQIFTQNQSASPNGAPPGSKRQSPANGSVPPDSSGSCGGPGRKKMSTGSSSQSPPLGVKPPISIAVTHHPILPSSSLQTGGTSSTLPNQHLPPQTNGGVPGHGTTLIAAQLAAPPAQLRPILQPPPQQNGAPPQPAFLAYNLPQAIPVVPVSVVDFNHHHQQQQQQQHPMPGPGYHQPQQQYFATTTAATVKVLPPSNGQSPFLNGLGAGTVLPVASAFSLAPRTNNLDLKPFNDQLLSNHHYHHQSPTPIAHNLYTSTNEVSLNTISHHSIKPVLSPSPYSSISVTHLSPSYWSNGLAAAEIDSLTSDPSTLIPPSLSGSQQVVLQPL